MLSGEPGPGHQPLRGGVGDIPTPRPLPPSDWRLHEGHFPFAGCVDVTSAALQKGRSAMLTAPQSPSFLV